MAAGLDSSNFFLVMPLPGTPLFESAMAEGYLPLDWNPDRMNWTKANMVNTEVPPQELEELRDRAWREINNQDYVAYKSDMAVN
jgi:anaerobic magnesium-protoporphyrin IX monomethyl ester cyclase